MRPTILLYNPISTSPGKQRLPLSLLAIAAVITDDYDIEFIDGNLIDDPATAIIARAQATKAKLLGCTVMAGPQLHQAVDVCRRVKAALPDLQIVWGGYFPTQHTDVTLRSDYVDYVIQGQGEAPFRRLVDTLHHGGALSDVPSLGYVNGGPHVNPRAPLVPLEKLPWYPYERIDVPRYVGANYLGSRVLSHHSSFGCPFACNFCAVVSFVNQRWLAESADRGGAVVTHLQDRYQIDGLEFHDMDFFVSESRAAAIADRLIGKGINWWALGRVDTLMGYSDATFEKLARSGAKMIFMGAESGDADTLERMNKGGQSSPELTLAIVERMKYYGIVPELSFVLGSPPDPAADIDQTIQFIRKIKRVNPATELILYIYTPVPQEDSLLLAEATKLGFRFPETLEAWVDDTWSQFALRRNPGTPWFRSSSRQRVRDFEAVINAYYPTVTDMRLRGGMRQLLAALSGWRYRLEFYRWPYELKALQRLVHYRRPETTGF
ncbi:MAG: B12-binding domain-containing radical SAM protein [Chloroflexi bacterium]|nr:B12-binding domain-containing radical SAM protein [Chloroflexota bacterium]